MGGAVEFNITSDPTPPEAPVASTRPENVPEKFWNAETKSVNTEALLASYQELEGKLGAPKDQAQAETPAAEEKPAEQAEGDDAAEKAAEDAAQAAGVSMEALQAEFDKDNALSEASYEKLAKAGFDKGTVDEFIEYRRSKADGYVTAVTEAAGPEGELAKMTEWATKGYTPAQIEAFNAAVNSGNKETAIAAVKALKVDFGKANGVRPNLVTPGTAPAAGGEIYQSMAQLLADQAKPEYRADPAFRENVRQKLARSSI